MYVIQTSHKDKDDTLTKPMEFGEACTLFGSMTGEDVSKLKEGDEASDGIITLRETANIAELAYTEDGVMMVDHIIDTFSQDRFDIAWKRAAREFSGLEPDPEEMDTTFGEDFTEEYHRQLKLMAAKELLDYFEKVEGIFQVTGADKDGELYMEVTERGHAILGT